VITNDVSDYINLLVRIAHIICNHPLDLFSYVIESQFHAFCIMVHKFPDFIGLNICSWASIHSCSTSYYEWWYLINTNSSIVPDMMMDALLNLNTVDGVQNAYHQHLSTLISIFISIHELSFIYRHSELSLFRKFQ